MEDDINPTPEKRKILEYESKLIAKKPRKVFILDDLRSENTYRHIFYTELLEVSCQLSSKLS